MTIFSRPRAGTKVVRTWTFAIIGKPLPPEPGVYGEGKLNKGLPSPTTCSIFSKLAFDSTHKSQDDNGGPQWGAMFWAFGKGIRGPLPRYAVTKDSRPFLLASEFFLFALVRQFYIEASNIISAIYNQFILYANAIIVGKGNWKYFLN
eukprot:jgi/Mesvir1/7833/Mv24167-RA.1